MLVSSADTKSQDVVANADDLGTFKCGELVVVCASPSTTAADGKLHGI